MRQYQVPQFITVEDKVIGPFTIKQFLFVGSGVLLIIGAHLLFEPILFWPISFVVAGSAAAFAFVKINGQPLFVVVKNFAFYTLRPRLYVWKQGTTIQKSQSNIPVKDVLPIKTTQAFSSSKLSDLAWSLDIKERRGEKAAF